MTLQEYEAQGGCEGCYFYGTIDVDGRKGCTFHWFDDESEDWEYSKGSYIQGCWNVGGKRMSRPTKTCYDCKNACWDSVPYGSTTATMFGGCDKEDEMTEEEAERFGETEDCPFWENRYKEENA